MAIPARARTDECPGVFATHDAADGAVARVRLPGGAVTVAQLLVLAGCAEDLGDGAVHLTSRGNIQLRGLSADSGELVSRLSAAGLLPAPSHERVRNILASPLSGLAGGLADVRPLVAELDAALCARPELAELPGRFLFALDDGRGDVSGEDADVCWRAVDAGAGALLLAGTDTGLRVLLKDAVEALVHAAVTFAAVRGAAWRIRELLDVDVPSTGSAATPVGVFVRDDGGRGICVAPVLGRLSAGQLRLLGEVSPWAVVTPWRSVVLPNVDVRLAEAGLLTDPSAPGLGISACIGRPGCAKSKADVRADAQRVPARVRAHFAGCERRCGRPHDTHVDVVADGGGYLVDGTWVPVEGIVDSLAQRELCET